MGNYRDPESHVLDEVSPSKLDKKAQSLKEAERAKLAAAALEVDPNAEPPFEIEKICNKVVLIPA